MNAPGIDEAPAPRGFDWRAIALGAGTSLAVGFAVSYLMRFVPVQEGAMQRVMFAVVFPLIGLVNDALGGAVAGFIARRRGAAHGALACVLASAASTAITLVRLLRMDLGATSLSGWLTTLPFWLALGIGVGAGAGALAVRAAVASRPRE